MPAEQSVVDRLREVAQTILEEYGVLPPYSYMNELIEYCRESILPVLRDQPPPRYGDWNYPMLADELEKRLNAAQLELSAPSFPSIMSSKPLND